MRLGTCPDGLRREPSVRADAGENGVVDPDRVVDRAEIGDRVEIGAGRLPVEDEIIAASAADEIVAALAPIDGVFGRPAASLRMERCWASADDET